LISSLHKLVYAIDHAPGYLYLIYFVGAYPVVMAIVWVLLSLIFHRRRETAILPPSQEQWPFVSILIAAYAEEATLPSTLKALFKLDYPQYEIIVINDGSPDRTAEVVNSFIGKGPVRLLNKEVNEGKAMALNDALPLCRGEILLVLDADIAVNPDVLRWLVPHFLGTRVAAVTGNPRVADRRSLLQSLQAIEFSSIISMQKRAQRIWGRVTTVSGAVAAFRRSAILDVGCFSPFMATEDIEITWRLQMKFWDIRYEPRAVVWMQAPPTFGELWKQRRRWARGLAQVLFLHRGVPTRWKWRRLWPVWYECIVSILWAHAFIILMIYWLIAQSVGYSPFGFSPIPNFWGMTIGTVCLIQLFTGALTDRRYDATIVNTLVESIYYPIIYWTLTALITCVYTIDTLVRRKRRIQTWKIERRAI
jgi:biofilm PGA synthesis N-glycosyltransferase PgaC